MKYHFPDAVHSTLWNFHLTPGEPHGSVDFTAIVSIASPVLIPYHGADILGSFGSFFYIWITRNK